MFVLPVSECYYQTPGTESNHGIIEVWILFDSCDFFRPIKLFPN